MKLMTEIMEDISLQEEVNEATGEKSLYITGPFMQAEQKNRNGRVYPLETLSREVQRYTIENIEKNRAYGELGHPQGPTINLERVSHMIKELHQDGSNIMGRAKIMSETPMGNIVKNLMDEGAKLGVSSRGMGTLRQKNGVNEVQGDFQLATAADIVADPSAPNAFVEGVMEGVEWIQNVNGSWVSQYIEETQEEIRSASKKDLQEAKFRAFTKFLQKL